MRKEWRSDLGRKAAGIPMKISTFYKSNLLLTIFLLLAGTLSARSTQRVTPEDLDAFVREQTE